MAGIGTRENYPRAQPTPGPGKFFSQTCASVFGGPGDPGTGSKGYKGDNLKGKQAFAELNMGTALGGLPYKTKVAISYKGKYVVVEKLDIGLGGAPCGGHARRIDLWWEVARQLGLSGTDVVSYQLEVTPAEAKKLEEEYPKGMGVNLQGGVESGVDAAKEAVEGAVSWTKDLSKILQFIGSSSGWVRIGKVVLGAGLLVIALSELTKISPEVPSVNAVGVAKKVVK